MCLVLSTVSIARRCRELAPVLVVLTRKVGRAGTIISSTADESRPARAESSVNVDTLLAVVHATPIVDGVLAKGVVICAVCAITAVESEQYGAPPNL